MAYLKAFYLSLRKRIIILAYGALLLVYYWIFGAFFPNNQGMIGHDYSAVLPGILDGYFWLRNNPIYEVPWFSPSFCGGQPFVANINGMFYMLPTFLTFFIDPLKSLQVNFLLLAAIGAWGMHRLLRDAFDASSKAALLGGALFLFNGFYAHRIVVGHLCYQGFMLLPWLAWALLAQKTQGESRRIQWLEHGLCVTLAGAMLAYWVVSGFVTLVLPGGLAVLAVAGLCLTGHDRWRLFLGRSAASLVISLALSGAALSAGAAFLSHFPRTEYLLPGIKSIVDAVLVLGVTLFLSPAGIEGFVNPRLDNVQWYMARHEWEFGITLVPLLLMGLLWGSSLFGRVKLLAFTPMHPKRLAAWAVLGICLVISLAVNIYSPSWNAFLKAVPFLKNSSILIRWWIVYIPVIIVYAALTIDKIGWSERYRTGLVLASILGILVQNGIQDRMFYHQQSYDPFAIVDTYWITQHGDYKPEIKAISVYQNEAGKIVMPPNRNDDIIYGKSQLACYNPAFGYRLEYLPVKTLHPGSVYAEKDGRLNLKNPACYVFPEENHCQPGDHFLSSQIEQAQAFARYQPFAFEISTWQSVANWVSLVAVVVVPCLFVFSALGLVRERRRSSGA